MSCDVGEVTERLENQLCSTVYSSAHSPTFPSLHLRHNSFSNPSVALPTSQLILQSFRRFTYVTAFSNPSFASPTSQDLHLRHLTSHPCCQICPFSKLSVTSPTSQHILQPFFSFSYVTGSSLTSPDEPPNLPMVPILSKIYPVSSITSQLPQIHFNSILPSASRPPERS